MGLGFRVSLQGFITIRVMGLGFQVPSKGL